MINKLDSPHLIVDPFWALNTSCDLHLWVGAVSPPPPTDGLCDLQANDAEKLLLMWHEWRGQLWWDCRLRYQESMQEINFQQFIQTKVQNEHMDQL